ncbi:hypothetical protein FXO38_13341 [Capsicum annuum]|nr:hypothetical protein FXO38_13341 [Capsicum annuum]
MIVKPASRIPVSTSNEIHISGFVPGNFDYKDSDFRENRSKYQNDPTIMKKLRDAASAKGKKPAVAISKGKKKGSCEKRTITRGDEIRDQNCFTLSTEVWHFVQPQQTKVGQKAKMTVDSLPLDDFDDFTKPSLPELLTKLKVSIDIDRCEKNETDDDLKTPKENSKDIPEKSNDLLQKESFPDELLQKENLSDLILARDNIEVRNKPQVSNTEISSDAFQESIDNIIDGMYTSVVGMAVNSDDLSQKVNFFDPFLQIDNVEVSNEPQESIDNIIAEIFTSVVVMEIKSVSPKEINNSECHIHDSRFSSVLPEADLGKQDAIKTCAPRSKKRTKIFMSSFTTEFGSSCKGKESAKVDFSRKHPFDGYLIFYDRPTGLIEQYCGCIVEGLLKYHEKK